MTSQPSTTTGLTAGTPELRRLNLAMVFATLAAFGMLYSTQALLPPIGSAFGVGPTAASLSVSAATGCLALAILPLSSLAESVGRVPVMRAGLLAGCLFTFAAAAAPVFWVLVLARGLVGVSLAAVVAVAVAHLGDEVHPADGLGHRRQRQDRQREGAGRRGHGEARGRGSDAEAGADRGQQRLGRVEQPEGRQGGEQHRHVQTTELSASRGESRGGAGRRHRSRRYEPAPAPDNEMWLI